jgi:hypothetical protein
MKELKPHVADWAQIDRFLASADKKPISARKAYEAMLKASLGFMFSHGFRARSQPGHHIFEQRASKALRGTLQAATSDAAS